MQVDGTYPSKGPMMTFQVYPAFGSVSRRCRRTMYNRYRKPRSLETRKPSASNLLGRSGGVYQLHRSCSVDL